jgi:membrane protease YdiL (CAAX protease family)
MNRKLILFIVSVFIFVIALFFIQQVLNIDFEKIMLTQFAPTLAYIITIFVFRNLFIQINMNVNKIIIIKTFLSIIIPFCLTAVVYYISRLIKLDMQIDINITKIMFTIGIGTIIGSIGEEIGWRSFLQPTMEKKYSVIFSSIIVGLIWGLWHMQHYINGILFVLVYVIFTISVSIILVFILKDTKYNIIISSIFHASINMSFRIFFGENMDSNVILRIFLINSIIWLIFAAIIVFCNKGYYMNNKDSKTSI